MSEKVLLMILDGWGKSPDPLVSAIDRADTPFIDKLYDEYHHNLLCTDGEYAGLPVGQMGNSEVGHMNIGAGRIVYQDLVKISLAVNQGTLGQEKVLSEGLEYAKNNYKNVHLLGLLSNGGVHSHIEHLEGLLKVTAKSGCRSVFLHAFTDGRDVDPKSGKGFVKRILKKIDSTGTKLASVIGRYYAMDRDRRWERIKRAYDLIVHGVGTPTSNIVESIQLSYDKGITDEFIAPLVAVDERGRAVAKIQKGDVVIFFNFRTDRGRQLTEALSQKAFPEHNMFPLSLHYITFTNYDEAFKNVKVVFEKENLSNTLGEVLSKAGKTQVRIAETEKYPHVTFFFNGGREEPFEDEERILCPSPKVATYDLKPEMSAYEVRDTIVKKMDENAPDFVCLNFANPDMVGHTGDMQAAIKACETVDQCAKAVVQKALEKNYTTLIIADHGNCETMFNPDGSPNTAHTTNPVPVILVDARRRKIKGGILGDIAPTVLDLMDIPKPEEMIRSSLIIES